MQSFAKSLKIISGFLGTAVKSFTITFIFIDILWEGFLAALAFWWASENSIWQGLIAVTWTIIAMGSLGATASLQFTVFTTLKRTIKLNSSPGLRGQTLPTTSPPFMPSNPGFRDLSTERSFLAVKPPH